MQDWLYWSDELGALGLPITKIDRNLILLKIRLASTSWTKIDALV
jgi:hypothetical protein